jgi:hypothetical protein
MILCHAHAAAVVDAHRAGFSSKPLTDWPRSSDPTAHSIEPPVAGGKLASDGGAADEPPTPAPPPDDANKVARLCMRHRVDLGLALASDEWLVAHTNDITAVFWTLSKHALDHNNIGWLCKYRWWVQAAIRLHHGEPAVKLDG